MAELEGTLCKLEYHPDYQSFHHAQQPQVDFHHGTPVVRRVEIVGAELGKIPLADTLDDENLQVVPSSMFFVF